MGKRTLATHSPVVRAAWANAIYEDHPCDDSGCDIAVARRNGFLEAASWLLHGATETPGLDAFERTHRINVTDDIWLIGWKEFHDENKRQCPSCEGFMYADEYEPDQCSNCLAAMPERMEDDE